MYREFIAPSDQEIIERLGEWPEVEEESGARMLTFRGSSGESILLSYDTLARSVRVRWENREGELILDLFRESATSMTVQADSASSRILIDFEMGECGGRMEISITPSMAIRDQLIFT
ncbi:hypothetical protein M2164_003368 [Streptomyces sp. SAI-208]|uniref:hypothetical protein n=1 Tax=Streptomyces sp. SAI-208 TaxID=2940550 RepID=UPI0024768424|nr:hypothetical protein [Streptomyces sp. SAI-208]MDH6607733.1 hypothetical protein [Streptomyces sp. SAI-208]